MDRRNFLKNVAAAGLAAGLEGCSMMSADNRSSDYPIERRTLGATGERLSVIGFGGIVVMNQTPQESANYVAEAFGRGINYFDVAPGYGNAQERLGPALKPYRDRCFLACKTEKRDAVGAEAALHESLRLLQTDHLDLYQLHAITNTKDDVERVFAPGGAMEPILKAREAGKIRFIGFSAHSEAAAHLAMDKFNFDSVLFPFNFVTWNKSDFGPSVYKRAREKNMGVLALKAMAHQKWPETGRPQDNPWAKCWYEPLDERQQVTMALRFTLGLPVDAALPPGHWELFKLALELVETGAATKQLSKEERDKLAQIAAASDPIFMHA